MIELWDKDTKKHKKMRSFYKIFTNFADTLIKVFNLYAVNT